jgi:hypothetical protein
MTFGTPLWAMGSPRALGVLRRLGKGGLGALAERTDLVIAVCVITVCHFPAGTPG